MAHCWIVLGCGTILTINMATEQQPTDQRTGAPTAATGRQRYRPATGEVPSRPNTPRTGTGVLSTSLGTTMGTQEAGAFASRTAELMAEAEHNIPGYITALEHLRDALVTGNTQRESGATRSGTGVATTEYISSTPRLTVTVIGDSSPSMDDALSANAWSHSQLRSSSRVAVEDNIFALTDATLRQMARGAHGEVDSAHMMFSLPATTEHGYVFTQEHEVAGNDKVIPGAVIDSHMRGRRGAVAKVVHPWGATLTAEDTVGVFALLRDKKFRDSAGTYLAPALTLLEQQIQMRPDFDQNVAAHREAHVVFIVTDGQLSSQEDAMACQAAVQRLRSRGVLVVPLLLDPNNNTQGRQMMEYVMGRGYEQYVIGVTSQESLIEGVETLAQNLVSQKGGSSTATARR